MPWEVELNKYMMKKVLLYPNAKRDPHYECTGRVARFFLDRNIEIYATGETAKAMSAFPVRIIQEKEKPEMDLAVVLGGDGTMLQGAHFLLGTGVPLLGINLGTLGYLTEGDPQHPEDCLNLVMQQDYAVENRLVLQAEVGEKDSVTGKILYAVNDFVIHRSLLDGLLTVRTCANGAYLADFRADGMIAATPTGSTAYNLSAGGPILSPMADNIILTPLCSHSMLDRSIILMGQDELSFRIGPSGKGQKALFSADGVAAASLAEGSWIRVKKSEYAFPLVRLLQRSFYEVLQKKMLR